MARRHQDHEMEFRTQGLLNPSKRQASKIIAQNVQPQAQQGFPQAPEPYVHPPEQTIAAHQQHGIILTGFCQVSAQERAYDTEQIQMLPMSPRLSHEGLLYISPYESLPTELAYQQVQQHQQNQKSQQHPQRQSSARKRPLAEFAYDYPEMHTSDSNNLVQMSFRMTSHSYHDPMQSQAYNDNSDFSSLQPVSSHLSLPAQGYHHHHLPNHDPPSKLCRTGYSGSVYDAREHSVPSALGQPGMPQPAARPDGPRHKFTTADDTLLVELKETKGLTWKQIESFFPGRTSGTLQVRYCTKLKAESRVWTETMIKRLRQAIDSYEHDRWRVVSGAVGKGCSAAACKDKADKLRRCRGESGV